MTNMWTNKKGISFYKKDRKYYRTNGWYVVEINKEEYEENYGKNSKTEFNTYEDIRKYYIKNRDNFKESILVPREEYNNFINVTIVIEVMYCKQWDSDYLICELKLE